MLGSPRSFSTPPTPELQLAEMSGGFLRAGDWAGAEAAYRKILAIQQQTGNAGLVAKPQMDLSQLFCLSGRLDEAWDFACAATSSARQTGLYPLLAMALRNKAFCALARGATIEALAAASEAVQVIEPGKIADLMRAQAYTIRAECLLADGHASAAISIGARLWDEMSKHYKTRTCVQAGRGNRWALLRLHLGPTGQPHHHRLDERPSFRCDRLRCIHGLHQRDPLPGSHSHKRVEINPAAQVGRS